MSKLNQDGDGIKKRADADAAAIRADGEESEQADKSGQPRWLYPKNRWRGRR